MVAYSFKKQFVEPIRAGTKRQTIRADRKRHARPGEELQLYCGMRTKHCFLIGRAQCVSVADILVDFHHGGLVRYGATEWYGPSLDQFAASDGFSGWEDMRQFWMREHGAMTFEGQIIHWRSFERPAVAPL